jgi:hypothetical protein
VQEKALEDEELEDEEEDLIRRDRHGQRMEHDLSLNEQVAALFELRSQPSISAPTPDDPGAPAPDDSEEIIDDLEASLMNLHRSVSAPAPAPAPANHAAAPAKGSNEAAGGSSGSGGEASLVPSPRKLRRDASDKRCDRFPPPFPLGWLMCGVTLTLTRRLLGWCVVRPSAGARPGRPRRRRGTASPRRTRWRPTRLPGAPTPLKGAHGGDGITQQARPCPVSCPYRKRTKQSTQSSAKQGEKRKAAEGPAGEGDGKGGGGDAAPGDGGAGGEGGDVPVGTGAAAAPKAAGGGKKADAVKRRKR